MVKNSSFGVLGFEHHLSPLAIVFWFSLGLISILQQNVFISVVLSVESSLETTQRCFPVEKLLLDSCMSCPFCRRFEQLAPAQ